MPLPESRKLIALRTALQNMDADLRKTTCPVCGKPTGGLVFAGQTPDSAGLCTRADHVREVTNETPKS